MTRKKSENGETATKPRQRKPKQQFIPGTEPPSIPAIDAAAEEYRDARDARMVCLKEEIKLGDALLALMHEHSLLTYDFDGATVTVDSKEKIKVRRKEDTGDGD